MPTVGRFDPEVFTVRLREHVEAAKGRVREAVHEGIQDVAEQLVVRTPVVTGFLRGSWFVTTGPLPSREAAPAGSPDPGGAGALARLSLAIEGTRLGDTVWIYNSAKYAMRVEFGFVGQDARGRTYSQAGRAWVRGVLAEAPAIFRAAAQRVMAGQIGGTNRGGGGATGGVGYTSP